MKEENKRPRKEETKEEKGKYGATIIKEEPKEQKVRTLFKIRKGRQGFNIKDLLSRGRRARDKLQELGEFKEPIAFLIRQTGEVEFYEGVEEALEFKHTNGENIRVNLPPNKMLTFNYANKKVRGYIHFENSFFPMPEQPILDAEAVEDIFTKAMTSKKVWEEQRKNLSEKRKGKMVWVWIIVAIFARIAMVFIFGGDTITQIVNTP